MNDETEITEAYYQSGYRDGYAEAVQALAAVLREAEDGFTAEVNKWLYQHGEDV